MIKGTKYTWRILPSYDGSYIIYTRVREYIGRVYFREIVTNQGHWVGEIDNATGNIHNCKYFTRDMVISDIEDILTALLERGVLP